MMAAVTTRRFPRSSGFGVNTRSVGIPFGGSGASPYYTYIIILLRGSAVRDVCEPDDGGYTS